MRIEFAKTKACGTNCTVEQTRVANCIWLESPSFLSSGWCSGEISFLHFSSGILSPLDFSPFRFTFRWSTFSISSDPELPRRLDRERASRWWMFSGDPPWILFINAIRTAKSSIRQILFRKCVGAKCSPRIVSSSLQTPLPDIESSG